MKIKMNLLFSGVLAAAMMISLRANAVNAGADGSTNGNLSSTMTSLFGDPVLAKGKGFEIKQSDLDKVMLGVRSALAMRGESLTPDQMTAVKGSMLSGLIQIQLLLQKSTDVDKAEGKKKADAQMEALLNGAGSQDNFNHELTADGWTPEEFQTKINQQATARVTLARELGVMVSSEEIKQYYDTHPADFEQPEMVHVRNISLMTIDPVTHAPLSEEDRNAKHKQIEDLLKQIHGGADFATLAKQYSEDPTSKLNGGELPPFPRDASGIPPEFAAAAFALKTNEVSDVVTSAYGYHIIQLIGKIPAKKFALTDKVPKSNLTISDLIKDRLTQQKVEKGAPAYLDKLKKAADVEILDPDLKAAVAAADAAALTNAPAEMP